MAKALKTTDKPRANLLGAKDGKPFSKDYQPSPEAKKKGWQELRQERHLTKSVIAMLIGEDGEPNDTFKGYLAKLLENAKKGNPKAIDVITKCLEDDILKVAQTDTNGNDVLTPLKVQIVSPIPLDED